MEFIGIIWTFLLIFSRGERKLIYETRQTPCTDEVKCTCRMETEYVFADCSNLHLRKFPKFYGNVRKINMESNLLQEFPSDGRIPKSVIYLNLANNMLRRFGNDSFKGLHNLTYLNLLSNRLDYNSSIFRQNIFEPLVSLQFLNIKRNAKLPTTLNNYPSALTTAVSLRNIEIDGIQDAEFGVEFRLLKHLISLNVSGSDGRCHITYLKANYFANLPYLRVLDLSQCNLHHVEKGSLQLTDLKFLNISHNKRLTFNDLSNITYDLQFTKVEVLDVSNLHCTYGPGTVLFEDDVIFLKNTSVKKLFVDGNRLSWMEAKVISALPPTLEFLSLKDSQLTVGSYLFFLNQAGNLKTVDGSDNNQEHRPNHNTNFYTSCLDWRAPKKSIGNDVVGFQKPCSNSARQQDIKSPIFTFGVPPFLENVIFKHASLYGVITATGVSKNNSIKYVNFHKNLLFSWQGPVKNLHQLRHLDLSSNFCSHISKTFLSEFPSLEVLILYNNLLGFILYKDINGETFHHNPKLQTIDLSINSLATLPRKMLSNQRQLQVLNLSINTLKSFDLDISHMTNLQYINLSSNRIVSLGKETRKALEIIISKNGRFRMDLHDNIFLCSCDALPFMKWIYKFRKNFDNFDHYQCRFQNGTYLLFSNLNNEILHLDNQCANFADLIIGVSAAIILCFILMAIGTGYRYRWKLRYLYYLAKRKYIGNMEHGSRNTIEYRYDAFISYAEEDSQVVKEQFVPRLEGMGYRLCLHQRDFTPGKGVAENISNAIHETNKTIVIWTPDYLKSYWCMYEFNMARMEAIYSRQKIR